MWLKVCKKADCYLLDEVLAQYRKGRVGSVSTHSIRTMIGWHYMLYHEAEGMGRLEVYLIQEETYYLVTIKKENMLKENLIR